MAGTPNLRCGVMRLTVKVVPGSTQEGIAGWLGDALKIRVRRAPQGGQANEAVRRVLAEALQLPIAQIRIVAGTASARKMIEVSAVEEGAVLSRLPARHC